jgi:hypothetical protein
MIATFHCKMKKYFDNVLDEEGRKTESIIKTVLYAPMFGYEKLF